MCMADDGVRETNPGGALDAVRALPAFGGERRDERAIMRRRAYLTRDVLGDAPFVGSPRRCRDRAVTEQVP